jgi:hypothetical protein
MRPAFLTVPAPAAAVLRASAAGAATDRPVAATPVGSALASQPSAPASGKTGGTGSGQGTTVAPAGKTVGVCRTRDLSAVATFRSGRRSGSLQPSHLGTVAW